MKQVPLVMLAAAVALDAAALSAASPQPETRTVHFKAGATSATINGTIKGDQAVDYLIDAAAGQHLLVTLTSKNKSAYFNLIAPSETDVAYYVGSNADRLNHFDGIVPASGSNRIRVYLYRAAARRGEVANYRLSIARTGGHATVDAKVAGTDFHATGELVCTTPQGSKQCKFGVHREERGSGWVKITRPNGDLRSVYFDHGKAIRYDGDKTAGLSVSRKNDNSIVRVGDETYIIPDAVIFGG